MNGESMNPQTETMASIHHIRNITPGAIATCAVLVCSCHLIISIVNLSYLTLFARLVGHSQLTMLFRKWGQVLGYVISVTSKNTS